MLKRCIFDLVDRNDAFDGEYGASQKLGEDKRRHLFIDIGIKKIYRVSTSLSLLIHVVYEMKVWDDM